MSRKRKQTLPKNKNSRVKLTHTKIFSGPIPTPETLSDYNLIDSTFAERIMKMAEIDQKSKVRLNNRASIFAFLITSFGMIFAIASIAGLLYGLYLAIDLEMESTIKWIVGCMASVGGVFIWRKVR